MSMIGKDKLAEETKFKTKYGVVTILSTSTFAEWHEDCSLALSSIGAEGIIEGTEERPAGPARAVEKFEAKLQEAKIILNGSVGRSYKSIAREYSRNDDVKGLWEKLNELNPAKTPHFASSLQNDLHKIAFDPKSQTIQEVVNKLQRIQIQLQETELRQSDEMIRQQLLRALPSDEFWPNQKMHVLANRLSLNDSILYLKSCESIAPSQAPVLASTARGRGGGGRYKGRGRYRREGPPRGRSQNWRDNKSRGNQRGKSQRGYNGGIHKRNLDR
ncbi:hypothetical protein K3495_g14902, partial [Podosphaera aphanis]